MLHAAVRMYIDNPVNDEGEEYAILYCYIVKNADNVMLCPCNGLLRPPLVFNVCEKKNNWKA